MRFSEEDRLIMHVETGSSERSEEQANSRRNVSGWRNWRKGLAREIQWHNDRDIKVIKVSKVVDGCCGIRQGPSRSPPRNVSTKCHTRAILADCSSIRPIRAVRY